MVIPMEHSNPNQLNQGLQQIKAAHDAKIHHTTTLYSLISTLTTAVQINSVLVLLLSTAIPFAIKMQLSSYVLIILGVLFGFLIGVSFAIVMVQKYINKLISKSK